MTEDILTACTKSDVDALPFNLDYIPKELKLRAKIELLEDESKTDEKLKSLRSLLKEEENLRWQDDDLFLLAFLRARKFDVKRACDLVKGFYTMLGKYGHIYYTLNFNYLKESMEENSSYILPYRDRDGSVIVIIHFANWDVKVITTDQHQSCLSLGLVQALLSPATQIAGVKVIFDFKEFSVAHLPHVKLHNVALFFQMIQGSIPIRMQGLHVVNENNVFSYVWSLAKMFISKKIKERVHVHGKDLQSLHKFFDPKILPAEYGGDQPSFDNTPWLETMEKSADYIQHVLSFGYEKYLTKYKKSTESNEANESPLSAK